MPHALVIGTSFDICFAFHPAVLMANDMWKQHETWVIFFHESIPPPAWLGFTLWDLQQFWKWIFLVRKSTTNSWLRFKIFWPILKMSGKIWVLLVFFSCKPSIHNRSFFSLSFQLPPTPPKCHASLHRSWSCFRRTLCGSWPELFGWSVCRSHCGHSSELQAESGTGRIFLAEFFFTKNEVGT